MKFLLTANIILLALGCGAEKKLSQPKISETQSSGSFDQHRQSSSNFGQQPGQQNTGPDQTQQQKSFDFNEAIPFLIFD